jgi:hypothetical protein
MIEIINEVQMLLLAMKTDTGPAQQIRNEIVEIVSAWHRGELLPKSEAPILAKLYGRSFTLPEGR